MIDDVLGWTMTALATVALPLALWSIYTLPAGPYRRCRGERRRWFHFSGLFLRGNCWHDLSGLHSDGEEGIRCPECGALANQRHPIRDGRRFRSGIMSLLIGLLAVTAGGTAWQRGSSWCGAIPTLPLVLLSGTAVGEHDTTIRDEVLERAKNGRISGYSACYLAEELMNDLRDDDVRWNATAALDSLWSLWPEARPALEAALVSDDIQKRGIAARIMRRKAAKPSQALLEACVEDLKDDREGPGYWFRQGNAQDSGHCLIKWYHHAGSMVRDAMASNDMQQRILSAAVCGFSGDRDAMEEAVPILTNMLRDNETYGDAKIAAPALYNFGPDVIPHLRPYTLSKDPQLGGVVRHLIERLENPGRTVHECTNRLPRITSLSHDPISWNFERCMENYW